MKNKVAILVIGMMMIFTFVGCSNNSNVTVENNYQSGREIKENMQIRFKDLVKLSELEPYNNKKVTAVGYLSPVMGYDESFGYLMNLPYQTCPYCIPDDGRITNTIAIFAPQGKKIGYTEAAVIVKGTLKLEDYVDDYGYEYSYRLIDVEIEEADVTTVGEKINLYNQVADKEILTGIMDSLYAVDNNVFYEEYIKNGYSIKIEKVDDTNLKQAVKNIEDLNIPELSSLHELGKELQVIIEETNKCIDEQNSNSLKSYQGRVDDCFNKLNMWMTEYEL